MEDLSLHVLDIVENSIAAGAKRIQIEIFHNLKDDLLRIEITDDGKGMDEKTVIRALDPFFTTKAIRRVGLGLSLFRDAARMANGDFTVESTLGQGTIVRASFQYSHIDRKPLGDMAKTMVTLIIGHPEIRFKYLLHRDGQEYRLDTEELETESDLSRMSAVELVRLVKKTMQEVRQVS